MFYSGNHDLKQRHDLKERFDLHHIEQRRRSKDDLQQRRQSKADQRKQSKQLRRIDSTGLSALEVKDLDFLSSVLPGIKTALFLLYFSTIDIYENRFVSLSKFFKMEMLNYILCI